jgi:hypothetical protein
MKMNHKSSKDKYSLIQSNKYHFSKNRYTKMPKVIQSLSNTKIVHSSSKPFPSYHKNNHPKNNPQLIYPSIWTYSSWQQTNYSLLITSPSDFNINICKSIPNHAFSHHIYLVSHVAGETKSSDIVPSLALVTNLKAGSRAWYWSEWALNGYIIRICCDCVKLQKNAVSIWQLVSNIAQ